MLLKPHQNPRHVFIIVLENEGYEKTFGLKSPATFLKSLAKQGALLQNYYGIGHYSLDNYIAMVSGQAPNPVTQGDCQNFIDFVATGTTADGQAIGAGCVYPSSVSTIVNQLELKGLTWKGYMEDMGNIQAVKVRPAAIPPSAPETIRKERLLAINTPAVTTRSSISTPSSTGPPAPRMWSISRHCRETSGQKTTPNYAFITPNLCHDGHDGGGNRRCVDGQPGGLVSADKFLAELCRSSWLLPAYEANYNGGLLIVTFDEADSDKRRRFGMLQ